MKCSFFHVHIRRRTGSNLWHQCRCGKWRWRGGYRWQDQPDEPPPVTGLAVERVPNPTDPGEFEWCICEPDGSVVDRFATRREAVVALDSGGYPEPCVGCGGTEMPLHVDGRCPNCHDLDAEVDECGPDWGSYDTLPGE